jgi:hypothetical protein
VKSYLLLRTTLSQYRSKFREYFPAIFLVCAIGYPAYFLLDSTSQSLARPVYSILFEPPPLSSLSHPAVRMALRVLFLFAESFVCWLAFVVSLAAITRKILLEKNEDPAPIRLSAAFQQSWSGRWGVLVVLSFLAACITTLFYEFVRPIFLRPVMAILFHSGLSGASVLTAITFVNAASVVLLCVMLAKMALGVTELVDDHNIPPGKAIRNSLAATLGWEWLFAVLFSAIAAAGFAIDHFLDDVFRNSLQYQQLNAIGREVIRGALRAIFVASGLMLTTLMFSNLYSILRYGAETAGSEKPGHSYSDN